MTEEEKAAAAKAAADAAAAKEAADKAAAEKAAADKVAADKAAAEKAEADRIAAEKAAGRLSDKEAELLKDVMKHKTAAREAEDRLKAFDGIDPAEYKRLKEAADKAAADKTEAEKKAAEKAGDFTRLKEMMAEEHKKELEAERAKVNTAQGQLDVALKTINDLTIGQSFTGSQFVTDELVLTPTIARQVYGDHFDVEGGKIVAYDKPRGAANRTKLVNGSGESIGFEDAIKKIVETSPDRDRIVRSKIKNGAGSRATDGRSTQTDDAGQRGVARISAALAKGVLKQTP
jgi:hypothetical protein